MASIVVGFDMSSRTPIQKDLVARFWLRSAAKEGSSESPQAYSLYVEDDFGGADADRRDAAEIAAEGLLMEVS